MQLLFHAGFANLCLYMNSEMIKDPWCNQKTGWLDDTFHLWSATAADKTEYWWTISRHVIVFPMYQKFKNTKFIQYLTSLCVSN